MCKLAIIIRKASATIDIRKKFYENLNFDFIPNTYLTLDRFVLFENSFI